ncbi:MAG: hypothetical protein AAFZ65_16435 [Planctomycetota bacterium]
MKIFSPRGPLVPWSLLAATFLLGTAQTQTIETEPRLLATLPDGVTLDFPPVRMGSQTYERGRVIRWSPKGDRVAYIGLLDGEEHPFIGDETLGAYDFIEGPYFAERTAECLFRVGNQVGKQKERWWLLLDGDEVFEEDWIGSPSISEDGELIALWSQPGARVEDSGAYNRGPQILNLLCKKGRSYRAQESRRWADATSLQKPALADGQCLAVGKPDEASPYTVMGLKAGKKKQLTLDELPGMAERLVVDASGDHWGATVSISKYEQGQFSSERRVVIDGNPIDSEAEEAFGPFFSERDDRIAICTRLGNTYGVELVGETVDPAYEYAHSPTFGADNRLAFIAAEDARVDPTFGIGRPDLALQGGQRFVVLRDRQGLDHPEDLRWDEIRALRFSPDGTRLAYAARRGNDWHVVVDGQASDAYDDVGEPRFTEDSQAVAFGARTDREFWWRVWDPADADADAGQE